ncbi:MAG: hypothetical protein LC800_01730 [Acidobacteria bacterium]|nr:hypothetical protein [Acidobacteriota bacterium]
MQNTGGGGGMKVGDSGFDFNEEVAAAGGNVIGTVVGSGPRGMVGTRPGRRGRPGGGGSLIRELLDEVRPGDLITSDFMRRLLAGLAGLEDYLGQLDDSAGIGAVPDVIFLQLPKALAMLRANEPTLKIEGAYDPFGNKIKLDGETARGERIVLAQFPVPGAKVTGDRMVKLLVSTEMSKWMQALEMLVDRGPDLISAWQRRSDSGEKTQTIDTTGPNAQKSEAAPAAEPAPGTASASTNDAATKTATKKTTKSRPRSKPS